MKYFPPEDDDLVVEAALAFIESLDPTDLTSPRQRKRRYQPGDSTRILHRKKAELNDLRNQVQVLEAWLEELKHIHVFSETEAHQNPRDTWRRSNQKRWASKTMHEFRKRRQAELTNRNLRQKIARQDEIGKAIIQTLEQSSAFEGMTFVFDLQPKVLKLLMRHNFGIVDALAMKTRFMYENYRLIFQTKDLPCFGCCLRPRSHNAQRDGVDIVSRTLVNCSTKKISDAMWEQLKVTDTQGASSRYVQEQDRNAIAASFTLALQSHNAVKYVQGFEFMQKFEKADHIVLVRAYELYLPGSTVQVQGERWTVFSTLANDLMYKCEIKHCTQLRIKFSDGMSIAGDDVRYIHETILDPWSFKLREQILELQETIMDKIDSASSKD